MRVHTWKFWNGRLPENQSAMLQRVDGRHNYDTRVARGRVARGRVVVSSGDHMVVGYRVPVEWRSLSKEQRGMG